MLKNETVRNLAIIILAVFLVWGWHQGKTLLEQHRFYRFDAITWAQVKQADRYYMAKYMVDNQMLLGKSRTEIIEKLGNPDVNTPGLILYDLGLERGGFRVDRDWLDFRFDDSDPPVVTRAFIRSD